MIAHLFIDDLNEDFMSNGERWSWSFLLFLCLIIGFKGGQFYERKKQPNLEEEAQKQIQNQVQQRIQKLLPQLKQEIKTQLQSSSTSLPSSEKSGSQNQNDFINPPSSTALSKRFQCPPPVCPPCDCRPPPKKKRKRGKKVPPPPKLTPLERTRLLAWVKRHASSLQRCRDASQPIYRLTVSLTLKIGKGKTQRIDQVGLKGRDLPRKTTQCIQNKIKKWPLDPSLKAHKYPRLVFGLQLD